MGNLRANAAVLFSGGLDSSILLAHMLGQGLRIQPIYIDSGLYWQAAELHWATRLLAAVESKNLEPLVVLSLPLDDLYSGHWSVTGKGVPRDDEPDEAVYLPGRNPLLITKARVWCGMHDVPQLALGSLRGNPFADATDKFFGQFEAAMDRAVSGHVELSRPLATIDKRQVMQRGRHLPLELTFSCFSPHGTLHCGACNKCGERQHAFRAASLSDPTRYASPAPTSAC